jgi:hypothetical protein
MQHANKMYFYLKEGRVRRLRGFGARRVRKGKHRTEGLRGGSAQGVSACRRKDGLHTLELPGQKHANGEKHRTEVTEGLRGGST